MFSHRACLCSLSGTHRLYRGGRLIRRPTQRRIIRPRAITEEEKFLNCKTLPSTHLLNGSALKHTRKWNQSDGFEKSPLRRL